MDSATVPGIRREIQRADYLAAYDQADRELKAGASEPQLRYLAVLALARAGATAHAARRYRELGLHVVRRGAVDDRLWTDCRALWPRIVKDMALSAPPASRPQLLGHAIRAYTAAYRSTGDYYPGINAATLLVLQGRSTEADALAAELLATPALIEPVDYWSAATRAEALVVLRRWDEAAAALDDARRHAGRDFGSVASTRRQLDMLIRAVGPESGPSGQLLSLLPLPRVAHYSGADAAPEEEAGLAAEVAAVLLADEVGVGVGTLWSTGAVVMAEQVLAHGAELHLVLPFSVDDYLAYFRQHRRSADEVARRTRCLEAATTLTTATADGDFPDPHLLDYAALVAAGLAQTRTRHLCTECIRVEHAAASADGRPRAGRNLRALHVRTVGAGGGRPALRPPALESVDPAREIRAFLFADVFRFSTFPESKLPVFWSEFMAGVAAAIDRHGETILYRNTWGDAFFLVISDIAAAASLALSIQERTVAMRKDGRWVPALRIALHHGPVFRGWDPIRGVPSYFGTQVSRAARLEPVVLPGAVYVTEPFAAILAVEAPDRFDAEYVGRKQLAKDYGEHRIYRLARRWQPGSEAAEAA